MSDRQIILPGGGPDCPDCGGPTFQVADDLERYERPWWCPDCNLRVEHDQEAEPTL